MTIFTAHSGYGCPQFLDLQSEFGYSSIFIMPENLISVHPFVSSTHINGVRSDFLANDESRGELSDVDGSSMTQEIEGENYNARRR